MEKAQNRTSHEMTLVNNVKVLPSCGMWEIWFVGFTTRGPVFASGLQGWGYATAVSQ